MIVKNRNKTALNGQESALIAAAQSGSGPAGSTKLTNKLAKLNTTQNKKEKKEKLKQTKTAASLSEPSNKKFAAACVTSPQSNTTASVTSGEDQLAISATLNSLMLKTKKEDVELHIKELSLLDLHSSEEDSAEILIKYVWTYLEFLF